MASLQLSSDLINIWERVGGDRNHFENRMLTFIEEEILVLLKPQEALVTKWKASENGRRDFAKYLLEKLGYYPPSETMETLWRYYTKRGGKQRNKSLALTFANYVEKQCMHCETKKGPFHVDHIIPLAKGGQDEASNLQCLCSDCNWKKGFGLDIKFNLFFNNRR
ncbi:hypothetical protein BEH_24665 (plasmid) [Priestia filamentosa]|uniref:HNH nuclease domain-containing protein n=1 Tax=Priestia filamentosa TaxID=1402861 RepID=A0A2S1M0K5_9BACI|nr:HNH endonuclease [Priestia filamentosa]AWG44894.1 hypothetical protein BEH_24665 [Priestia filamentosa]